MPDSKVIRFARYDGADTALPRWPDIPAAGLESGLPVQGGITYFEKPKIGLSAGVWECTAFTGKMEPYPVHEFMLLLEGEVTIAEAGGMMTTVRAGESFIVPRGLTCQWKQPGYVKKYFVIFEEPASAPVAKNTPGVIKLDHRLIPTETSPAPAAETLFGPVPQQRSRDSYTDPSGQLMIGIWDTSYYHRKIVPFPRYELMHILEGSVSMTHDDGSVQAFAAGDTLFVPFGTMADFKVGGDYLRKIYVIFAPHG